MAYGPYIFTSGYNPQRLEGPQKRTYAIEHKIPGSEGGIVEYLGSEQGMYQIRGFISPSQDGPSTGNAAAVLSGTSYVGVGADQAAQTLFALRGSGAQLLRIESTTTQYSGYMNLYENDFYYVEQINLSYEPGHGYPYYPFNLRLRRAGAATHGNSSGTSTYTPGAYFSGYLTCYFLNSGYALGEAINSMGFYALTVASGNVKMAFYNSLDVLVAQTAAQPVHSGLNWFPLRPSFVSTSGDVDRVVLKSDATSSSGWSLGDTDTAQSVIAYNSVVSGQGYGSAFPASISGLHILKSGFALDFVVVAA
jgi:hypothetical protein